jgi:hypothetical protein
VPDWVEPAGVIVTAVSTTILAVATFWAVQASKVTAEAAQRTIGLGTRCLLVPTRPGDPDQSVVFHGRAEPRIIVPPASAVVRKQGDEMRLAIALRNVGPGLALLYGWSWSAGLGRPEVPPAGFEEFDTQARGLYVAPGDTGFWQARARGDTAEAIRTAAETQKALTVDLLYGDEEGGQGRVSRFHLRAEDNGVRPCDVVRHWTLEALGGDWARRQGALRLRTGTEVE